VKTLLRTVPVLILVAGAACASDPYLAGTIGCIDKATTRAQADACRAQLRDAAPVAQLDAVVIVKATKEGGAQ
jgi:hypothetical protein